MLDYSSMGLNTGVSIPQWFDYNKENKIKVKVKLPVSIPQWFDYNSICIIRSWRIKIKSQFHNGSITTFTRY